MRSFFCCLILIAFVFSVLPISYSENSKVVVGKVLMEKPYWYVNAQEDGVWITDKMTVYTLVSEDGMLCTVDKLVYQDCKLGNLFQGKWVNK